MLEEIGMHCALVSEEVKSPRFIILHYRGASDPEMKPKILVGKSVTFDTGGISLKLVRRWTK